MSTPSHRQDGPNDAGGRPSAKTDIRGFMEGFQQRMSTLQERAADSATRVSAIKATVVSDDEEISVTVGASGELLDIQFGRSMRQASPEWMTQIARETYRRAREEAGEQVKEVMSETMGADSTAMRVFTDAAAAKSEASDR
ncbi:YbaB/EbfC family nucleoid-associated protein [Glycomyces sp. NPDC046736]|uniref:YbaB/EbfC family nucleoid-associated protein n=1 Tax=Glycomyces sp. NPDC046736 TaxID=3155615 RepID=UPI0033D98CFA